MDSWKKDRIASAKSGENPMVMVKMKINVDHRYDGQYEYSKI